MTETTSTALPQLNTATADVPAVDKSSTLSPSSPNTRSQLEGRLSRRPEAKELVDRNILHGTTSAAFQQSKDELQHAILTDTLKKGLASRPERKELEDRGILPNDNIAPSIVAQKKDLEKSMLSDSLNTKLSQRPSPDDLVKKGILEEGNAKPE
ncbi:hypothetical protein TWF694_004193 [Orbilia ellipsospora]|uniref:RPEL repeat protein n=1 Tax=Orbilia ellipsospora TaxID=2528407 RepID=A0AAV9WXD6_9PEZI